MRDIAARCTVLIVVMLLVTGCPTPTPVTPPPEVTSPPRVTPPPAITPAPTSESGDTVIEGKSGPKRGDVKPVADLPKKDGAEKLPPINETGGTKPAPEEIKLPAPGSFDKAEPEKVPGVPGEGPKKESGISLPEQPYGRVQFVITKDRISPQTFQVLPGPLIPSDTIDGELIYVATIDNQPVAVGSFRDPLVAVALPFEKGQDYLAIPQAEGQFAISLPAELLQPELLRASLITFYRLDPAIPFDTPLTVATVDSIQKRSEPIASVEGSALYELYLKSR
jgi:hypothetical protein